MHLAIIYNEWTEIVLELIKSGSDVNARACSGYTALHYTKSICIALELIKNKADVNIKTLTGDTALHFASKRGDVCMLQLLIQYSDPTIKNNKGQTALDVAKIDEIRDLILDAMVDIKEPDCNQ